MSFKLLFTLIVAVIFFVSASRTLEKAGQPGWVAFVPILWPFSVLKMIGKPYWWLLLLIPPLTPFTLFVIALMAARSFGKSLLFGMGLYFLPVMFIPLLGFSDARYLGPSRR